MSGNNYFIYSKVDEVKIQKQLSEQLKKLFAREKSSCCATGSLGFGIP